MFVHTSQVAEIVRRHPAVSNVRLVVTGEMANDGKVIDDARSYACVRVGVTAVIG